MIKESFADRAFSSLTRKEIKALLRGGYSHAKFERVIGRFPIELRGIVPAGLPYSAWQILEHIRVVQQNMLCYTLQRLTDSTDRASSDVRFCRPYWTKQPSPPDDSGWDRCVRAILEDRGRFESLIEDVTEDALIAPSAPRNHKTMLRLALQIADHTAYHTGQLVMLRRLLRCWKT